MLEKQLIGNAVRDEVVGFEVGWAIGNKVGDKLVLIQEKQFAMKLEMKLVLMLDQQLEMK